MARTRVFHGTSCGKYPHLRGLPEHSFVRIKPEPRIGRPPKHDVENWTVTDDWPACVPVTDAEVDVFEAWFGDLFDELFAPDA